MVADAGALSFQIRHQRLPIDGVFTVDAIGRARGERHGEASGG
jgi:hypothetical protein